LGLIPSIRNFPALSKSLRHWRGSAARPDILPRPQDPREAAIVRSLICALIVFGGALFVPFAAAQNAARMEMELDRDDAAAKEPLFQSYEPTTAGYTKNSNDVPFMDVNFSVKYRLLPVEVTGHNNRAFLALTTRFGFYWGTRENSPVIGKDYNPKLFWRFLPDGDQLAASSQEGVAHENLEVEYADYFDAGYAHESNGQLIHTQAEYIATQKALQQAQYVNDNVHRGWDYFEGVWKTTLWPRSGNPLLSRLDLKFFVPKGLLQGDEDQYHPWENNPQGKPRDEVDGISELVRFQLYEIGARIDDTRPFSRPDITLSYTTGYHNPFQYSTVRAELGFQFYVLPLALWAQSGYMSDLAMYYEKVNSYGLEIRIRTF